MPSSDFFFIVFFCLRSLSFSTASLCTSSRAGGLVFWPQCEHSWRRRCAVCPSPGKNKARTHTIMLRTRSQSSFKWVITLLIKYSSPQGYRNRCCFPFHCFWKKVLKWMEKVSKRLHFKNDFDLFPLPGISKMKTSEKPLLQLCAPTGTPCHDHDSLQKVKIMITETVKCDEQILTCIS